MAKGAAIYAVVGLIIGLLIGAGAAAAYYMGQPPRVEYKKVPEGLLPSEVAIGVLLPLTGDLATYGENGKYAIELAEADINDYVKSKLGLDITFKFYIEDTKTSAEGALNAIKTLAAKGIKFVLGPYASSEVRNIMSYAQENDILIVSPSSTAPALAVAGDNVFRTVPTDLLQGKALAKVIWESGIRKLVIIYRNDDWGIGLANSVKENFEALGGEAVAIPYDYKAKVFSTEVQAAVDAVNNFGAGDDVGICLISFEEDGISVIVEASAHDVLMNRKWFGSDGIAYSSKVLTGIKDYADQLGGIPSTIYIPAASAKKQAFIDRFMEKYKMRPHPYSMNLYDSAWIIALSILEARAYDSAKVKELVPVVANYYFGVSGWTALDDAGDRAYGDYVVTAIINGEWKDIAVYSASADIVTWLS